ncbi:TetR/AcrR family transcriptional regulator [uncultured Jatrophihabitans sp.]|uniref:TetR/AcrR family transcriptional regulator n=1 Tax=uncultured Jatrophihabitans sp. TaxID=1610747 RepID=UPI0035CC72D6
MATEAGAATRRRAGRQRDHSRDAVILEATLAVLAEHGYDRMTIDLVAARAGMARATVYRRWPTKAELVLDAVGRLSSTDVGEIDAAQLPDTGTLREDMIAMIRPFDDEQQQIRIQAVIGLLVLARTDDRLAQAALGAGIGPWIDINRALMQRAVDRGEFAPPADLETLAELIPMMCVSRAVQQLPITYEFSVALIDGVIIPALRGTT